MSLLDHIFNYSLNLMKHLNVMEMKKTTLFAAKYMCQNV